MQQSSSTGVWYYECPRQDTCQFLFDLQAKSILYPDEREFLQRAYEMTEQAESQGQVARQPVIYKTITMISKPDCVELIVNREQEKLDVVTQLPSRVVLLRQLSVWNTIEPERRIGVCVLELDKFSNINDSLGHATGDLILYDISRRLEKFSLFPFKLARLHGDEFALAVTGLEEPEDIWQVSNWIMEQFVDPFVTKSGNIYLTASIGVSLSDIVGFDAVSLLESAYIALNNAKNNDLVREFLYSPQQHKELTKQVLLESHLNLALACDDQLEVWYQPKQLLNSGALCGLEALIRWKHPEQGIISPAEFIPLAERTGLVVAITDYVIKHIARDLPKLRAAGLEGRIAINVSTKDFQRRNVVSELTERMQRGGISTSDVELEITEGALLHDFDQCVLMLEALRQAGFELSIDDFGTGYSSLSYLTRLPVDTIKIDMSFVRQIVFSERARKIYQALINMCDAVGLDILAEGVDDDAQRKILGEIGCTSIQGYLLSKPMPLDQTIDYIKSLKMES